LSLRIFCNRGAWSFLKLPEARRARMTAEYDLNPKDAATLTASREFADRFEAAARTARNRDAWRTCC